MRSSGRGVVLGRQEIRVAEMTAILSWLASLLTGPIVNGVIDGYKASMSAVASVMRVHQSTRVYSA